MTVAGHPSLRLERQMMRAGAGNVVGIDEVGRGSLAGPVTVGAVLVLPGTDSAPSGVRDSKELPAAQRFALAPRIARWAPSCAIGHAWPDEIDVLGMIAALRLATNRALVQLDAAPVVILLDGSHDWLSKHADGLPKAAASATVTVRVKADQHCSSVAAASVLAKVARDSLISELGGGDDPYRWRSNKGYSAPDHVTALETRGPTLLHRLSWDLPGVSKELLDTIDPGRIRTARRFDPAEQLLLLDERAFSPDEGVHSPV